MNRRIRRVSDGLWHVFCLLSKSEDRDNVMLGFGEWDSNQEVSVFDTGIGIGDLQKVTGY